MLGHERVASERIIILPADQATDPADCRFDDLEGRSVTDAPDHSFVIGSRNLAMFQAERAVGIEYQHTIIQRAVVAFVDPDCDHRIMFARGRRNGISNWSRRHDCILIKTDMFVPNRGRAMGD